MARVPFVERLSADPRIDIDRKATPAILTPRSFEIIDQETERLCEVLAGEPTAWRRAIIRDRVKSAVKAALNAASRRDESQQTLFPFPELPRSRSAETWISNVLPRCLWYLEYVRQNRGVGFATVSDRWSIAERTFFRDAARLRHAGYDVEIRDGRMFVHSWRSESMG